MGNNKESQTVIINGKEFDLSTFTEHQRLLLDHCIDLEKKINSCRFQLDQLTVGKDAFLKILSDSLEAVDGGKVDSEGDQEARVAA